MAQPYQLTCASLLKDAVVQLLRQKVVYTSSVDIFGTICIRVDKSQDEVILKINEKFMRNTIVDSEESLESVVKRQCHSDNEIKRKNLHYGILKTALETNQGIVRKEVNIRTEKEVTPTVNLTSNKTNETYRSRRKSKPKRGWPTEYHISDEEYYSSHGQSNLKHERDNSEEKDAIKEIEEMGLKLIHSPQPSHSHDQQSLDEISKEEFLENSKMAASSLTGYASCLPTLNTALGHSSAFYSSQTAGVYIKEEPQDEEFDDPYLALQLNAEEGADSFDASTSSLPSPLQHYQKGKWRTGNTSGPPSNIAAATVKDARGATLFQCSTCSTRFETVQACCAHNKTDHRVYMCRLCYKGFSRSTTLSRHTTIHTGSKPYKCTICDAEFNRRYRLKNHVLNYHVQQRFPCTFCPPGIIVCNDFRNLQVHLQQKHGLILPFLCQECKTVVKGWITYMQHLGYHPGHSVTTSKLEIKEEEADPDEPADDVEKVDPEPEPESAESNTA